MTLPRSSAESTGRIAHSVSLKVLRLSRPSCSIQFPLPLQSEKSTFQIDSHAASAYPSADSDASFILTPALKLPAAFGSAHVGETFACTLCVNNELPIDSDISVTDVKLSAEMQVPAEADATIPLQVETALEMGAQSSRLAPAETLQGVVRLHLSDEGNYVLIVSVSYVETLTPATEGADPIKRDRMFRKLYQFPATQLIRVRIKTRPLPVLLEKSHGKGYAIEAQLEKLGEDSLVLEEATLNAKGGFRVKSLNSWDVKATADEALAKPMLSPGDVLQAAFLLMQEVGAEDEQELAKDGRVLLGQMAIRWRGAMGEPGLLNTGWLSGRRL